MHHVATGNQVVQHRLDRWTPAFFWLDTGPEHRGFELLFPLLGVGAERALQQRLQRWSIQLDDPLRADRRERVAAGLDKQAVTHLDRCVAPSGQYILGLGAVVVRQAEEVLERARRCVGRRPWRFGDRHDWVVPAALVGSVVATSLLLSPSGRRAVSITVAPRPARALMR